MCAPLKKRERRINVSSRLFPLLFPPLLSTIVKEILLYLNSSPFCVSSESRIGYYVTKLESNEETSPFFLLFHFIEKYRLSFDFCTTLFPRSIFTRSCKSFDFHFSLVVNNILYSTTVKGKRGFFLSFLFLLFVIRELFISRYAEIVIRFL